MLYTHAGIEIGVAATKTFTTQVALLLRSRAAPRRSSRRAHAARRSRPAGEIRALPHQGAEHAWRRRTASSAIAERHADKPFFFFLGRHVGLPVCLEGALKLKEITYIPTEAYAAGEMKHGPIALLDERDAGRLRGDPVARVGEAAVQPAGGARPRRAGDRRGHRRATRRSRRWPRTCSTSRARTRCCSPSWRSIPLQLLAYRIARLRGLDVDQPRNLAKTVTVE